MEGTNLLFRLQTRIVELGEWIYQRITTSQSGHLIIFVTFLIFMLTYYIYQKTKSDFKNHDDKVRLIELKAETYHGLIRLLKPGCRSIILLCDSDSERRLLPKFRNIVRPYRRNKSLLFGYLRLEKNLSWFESLLYQAVQCNSTLYDSSQIKVKNCIGTVLSLNGYSRYFCVYHVKHIEGQGADEQPNLNKIRSTVDVDRLLDNLPNWLNKMFDGITRRYHIDYWPDNLR